MLGNQKHRLWMLKKFLNVDVCDELYQNIWNYIDIQMFILVFVKPLKSLNILIYFKENSLSISGFSKH